LNNSNILLYANVIRTNNYRVEPKVLAQNRKPYSRTFYQLYFKKKVLIPPTVEKHLANFQLLVINSPMPLANIKLSVSPCRLLSGFGRLSSGNFQLVEGNLVLHSANVEKYLHNVNKSVGNGARQVGNGAWKEGRVREQ
jgi:hypothetical protein